MLLKFLAFHIPGDLSLQAVIQNIYPEEYMIVDKPLSNLAPLKIRRQLFICGGIEIKEKIFDNR